MEQQQLLDAQKRPPKRPAKIEELRPGDMLFASGTTGGLLGQLISLGQFIDGVGYSHCGIFDGECVVEAGLNAGVVRNPLDRILSESKYTDIHRFLADDGKSELGDEGWPAKPVIDKVNSYCGQGYSSNDAVLAAILLLTQKSVIGSPAMAILIRSVLDEAVRILRDLVSKEPPDRHVTCSELVYRAYTEAQPKNKYMIAVRSIPYATLDLTEPRAKGVIAEEPVSIPIAEAMPFARQYPDLVPKPAIPHSPVVSDILKLANEFEATYRNLKGSEIRLVRDKSFGKNADGFRIEFPVVADYVSPGDLVRSGNTAEIGRLPKE